MSLDFSGLGDLSRSESKSAKSKSTKSGAWQPLRLPDLIEYGEVLAFDQSLSATGWVHLRKAPAQLWVVAAGTESGGDPQTRGPEQSLDRGLALYDKVVHVVSRYLNRAVQIPVLIVFETPPVGGKMSRPESSLLAGLVVKIAADRMAGPRPVMVSAQRAKKVICGDANADKRDAHASLLLNCAPWISGYSAITNEAHRDAAMIGLTALLRGS